MKDKLVVSNMTREEKVKEWYTKEKFTVLCYVERDEHDRVVYQEYSDGDYYEYSYDKKNQTVFKYICWKTTNGIEFTNIILKPKRQLKQVYKNKF